jgi:hypothetical protein
MPLTTVLITATQSIAYPNLITLTNASVGTDATLTSLRVFIRNSQSQYLYPTQQATTTPTYTVWSYADGTFEMDVLTEATSPEITVQFMAGTTVVYTFTDTFCFDLQDYVFGLGVLAAQTSSPGVLQDTTYYSNFTQFIVNLFCGETAITKADDIYSSQNALNRNQLMMNNESYYF